MDEIVIKSKLKTDLITDLTETFPNLCKYRIKLNPEKCVFSIPVGKLLGFIVSERGIEANPEKIKAIEGLKQPKNLCDVQRLTACVAALSRFISRLSEKAMPLYRFLKKSNTFTWNDETSATLTALNKMMAEAPILASPLEKEPMLLYIATSNRVVSAVVIVERKEEGHELLVQGLVYYVSEVLTDSKERYPHY